MPARRSPHSTRNKLGRALWAIAFALLFRPSPRPMHRWRNWLLRAFGASLHPTARVNSRARVWAPWNLAMDEWSTVGDDVDLYCVAPISIGAGTTVSQYSYLCAATHNFDDARFPLVVKPITIGARCWLAADVFVGPGVTIGEGTVVGARSSVLRDLPEWVVAAGTPARPLRLREPPADRADLDESLA